MPFFIFKEKMSRLFIIILIVFQCGCASLLNGKDQIQPVKLLDSKTQIFMTTCSGMAETIGSCYAKAKEACAKGYTLLFEKLDSSGVHREIRFQCR